MTIDLRIFQQMKSLNFEPFLDSFSRFRKSHFWGQDRTTLIHIEIHTYRHVSVFDTGHKALINARCHDRKGGSRVRSVSLFFKKESHAAYQGGSMNTSHLSVVLL